MILFILCFVSQGIVVVNLVKGVISRLNKVMDGIVWIIFNIEKIVIWKWVEWK